MIKNKKIGVSYNVFDGEELLPGSIECIGDIVDFVTVVYQEKSNIGNEHDIDIKRYLEELVEDGLIDTLIRYEPDITISTHANEILKRNIGLTEVRDNGCHYHINMDTDEYYKTDEFEKMCEVVINGGYNSSAYQMCSYFKDQFFQLSPKETYYVNGLHKIEPDTKFLLNHPFPVLVDPTRRVNTFENCKIFMREDIEMHHMSHVRRNYHSKLVNSSASHVFTENMEFLLKQHKNWVGQGDVKLMTPGLQRYKIINVDNNFNLW